MALTYDYEGSSEGAVRHWEVPYSRLENTTPTEIEKPVAMKSRVNGSQATGTILTLDSARSIAIVDFTHTAVYKHSIRNVLTYAAGVEATWGEINIGDTIYYDRSSTMPADVDLSTSPLDKDGNANAWFGNVVLQEARGETSASFPKGANGVASTQTSDVMQR